MPRSIGVEERVRESVARTIRSSSYPNNRASELGHECLRYLVYCREEGDKRLLHDATLQLIFDEGKLHEPAIIRRLEDAGFTIVETQRTFNDKDLELAGHIDGKILVEDEALPLEIKTMSPHIFERVTGMDDPMAGMLTARQVWLRKYPAQLTTYMALGGKREGVFVFKHKVTGRLVDRVVEFDPEYWKALRMRCEAVNFHLQAGTLPGRITDSSICTECAFRHICTPDVDFGDDVEFVAELVPLLDRRAELRQKKKESAWLRELDEVEEHVKGMVAGRNKIIAGRWRGSASQINVPEKKVRAYSYERWRWKEVDLPTSQDTS